LDRNNRWITNAETNIWYGHITDTELCVGKGEAHI